MLAHPTVGAAAKVAATTALRAAIIGTALYLVDPVDPRIVKKALASAVAIEIFVFGWLMATRD